ncbi:hypothetical protein AB0D42_01745 [Streptomyces sp. NPDC048304]|uniref:hypothetical protein n=1 Tax=Streptomyces sp. NPDC048304 TaxID=3154820 RepID=UPI0033D80845
MTEMDQLITHDNDFWISELPGYQRDTVKSMLSSGMELEAVSAAWLSGSAATNTAPFGANLGTKLFFEKFQDQMHDFLCTGLNYEEERAAVMAGFKPKQSGLAATISAAIAPHLGASAVFLAPVVALTLCAVGKMGLGAWCQMQTERRSASEGSPLSTNDGSA